MMLSAYATLRTSCKEAHLSLLGWSINGLLLHSWIQNKMLMMQSNPPYRVPTCALTCSPMFRNVRLFSLAPVPYTIGYHISLEHSRG